MPQVDKVTFLSIIYSVLVLYFIQYLLLSTSHLYIFISYFKLFGRRLIYNLMLNKVVRKQILSIMLFP